MKLSITDTGNLCIVCFSFQIFLAIVVILGVNGAPPTSLKPTAESNPQKETQTAERNGKFIPIFNNSPLIEEDGTIHQIPDDGTLTKKFKHFPLPFSFLLQPMPTLSGALAPETAVPLLETTNGNERLGIYMFNPFGNDPLNLKRSQESGQNIEAREATEVTDLHNLQISVNDVEKLLTVYGIYPIAGQNNNNYFYPSVPYEVTAQRRSFRSNDFPSPQPVPQLSQLLGLDQIANFDPDAPSITMNDLPKIVQFYHQLSKLNNKHSVLHQQVPTNYRTPFNVQQPQPQAAYFDPTFPQLTSLYHNPAVLLPYPHLTGGARPFNVLPNKFNWGARQPVSKCTLNRFKSYEHKFVGSNIIRCLFNSTLLNTSLEK